MGSFALCGGRGGLRALHLRKLLKKLDQNISISMLVQCEHRSRYFCVAQTGRESCSLYTNSEYWERHLAAPTARWVLKFLMRNYFLKGSICKLLKKNI